MKAVKKLDQPQVTAALFHPRPVTDTPSVEGMRLLTIPVDDGATIVAHWYAGKPENPTILFFHGNGETAADYAETAPHYLQLGINLIVVDYRGYGQSSGTPTASTMLADCHAVFAAVADGRRQQAHTGPLFLMGRSLGSACALELAAAKEEEVAGLIIDSGFASTLPLLYALGVPVEELQLREEDGFNNAGKIASFTKPTFILHGQHDEIIPLQDAERLQANCGARSKEFQIVPGADHNGILNVAGHRYFTVLHGFINKALKTRPRKRR